MTNPTSPERAKQNEHGAAGCAGIAGGSEGPPHADEYMPPPQLLIGSTFADGGRSGSGAHKGGSGGGCGGKPSSGGRTNAPIDPSLSCKKEGETDLDFFQQMEANARKKLQIAKEKGGTGIAAGDE